MKYSNRSSQVTNSSVTTNKSIGKTGSQYILEVLILTSLLIWRDDAQIVLSKQENTKLVWFRIVIFHAVLSNKV